MVGKSVHPEASVLTPPKGGAAAGFGRFASHPMATIRCINAWLI